MIIAWKNISTESKLISGASCISWRSRLGHYPKNLWWTSLISLERTLSYLRTYYVPLAQLTRIVIIIQVVEKSCSMCTPTYAEVNNRNYFDGIFILKHSEIYTKLMTTILYILREKGGWILENWNDHFPPQVNLRQRLMLQMRDKKPKNTVSLIYDFMFDVAQGPMITFIS